MKVVVQLLQSISYFSPRKSNYKKIWKEYSAQKNVFGVVAELDGVIIGYGSVVIETKIRGGRVGHVEDIVCSPNKQRQGIASKILDKLFQISKKKNCYRCSLVRKPNNKKFYIHNHYKDDGRFSMTRLLR
tara:strand:+ start:117 stop:506 length:390 start_codon:yes stop_codon:yes gene_type:complete